MPLSFIHAPVGHLSGLQVFAIMNNRVANILVHVRLGGQDILWSISLRAELLHYKHVNIQLQEAMSNYFPKWWHQFSAPLASYEGSSCSISSPTLAMVTF